jgi:hypothetical protein
MFSSSRGRACCMIIVMTRIVVSHSFYGCDTGCCGHVVEVDDERVGEFQFDHPYGEDPREFAEEMVRETLGAEHVADLDWDNCLIVDD